MLSLTIVNSSDAFGMLPERTNKFLDQDVWIYSFVTSQFLVVDAENTPDISQVAGRGVGGGSD